MERPLALVVGAVIDTGRVLLLKRNNPPYEGYWTLPGGKIEFGEHPRAAAVREIREETGLDCDCIAMKGFASEIIEDSAHFLIFVCLLKQKGGVITPGLEGEVKWMGLNDLRRERVCPSDIKFIEEFIFGKGFSAAEVKMINPGTGKYELEEFKRFV